MVGLDHAFFLKNDDHILNDVGAEGVDVIKFVSPNGVSILYAFFEGRAKHRWISLWVLYLSLCWHIAIVKIFTDGPTP
ncbi:MAG: hypothetical protein Ct9H300mP23_08900 [Nitrospinota bacterium]|nr:MAG: hypothetical protein Ct9H300mP23_08900 [Nitrospinota bacterium]